jgi:hypothetical protein
METLSKGGRCIIALILTIPERAKKKPLGIAFRPSISMSILRQRVFVN